MKARRAELLFTSIFEMICHVLCFCGTLSQGGVRMIDLLLQHQSEIAGICRSYGVRRLDVFGSAARGSDYEPGRSDIDFIADFESTHESGSLFLRYMDFAGKLEKILGAHVDVLTPDSIRNPHIRSSVDRNRECVYAR